MPGHFGVVLGTLSVLWAPRAVLWVHFRATVVLHAPFVHFLTILGHFRSHFGDFWVPFLDSVELVILLTLLTRKPTFSGSGRSKFCSFSVTFLDVVPGGVFLTILGDF